MTPCPWQAFAPTSLVVKRESASGIPAHSGGRQVRAQGANFVEHLDVGCGRRARRLSDRRLIDLERGSDELGTPQGVPSRRICISFRGGPPCGLSEVLQSGKQHAAHERALAGAGNAADHREPVDRETDGKISSGCGRRAPASSIQPGACAQASARTSRRMLHRVLQVRAGQGIWIRQKLPKRSAATISRRAHRPAAPGQ